ncbi:MULTISPECIES: carbohydrate ABC transporter permease [Paenibacillus]|uniref:ABC transporter permease n=1 Tax=Paenibacillus naphthalenovorans TaxID=162209 RepID=A0A0U2VQG1_9BACL|nr:MULTISPECIES: sugar ABC transporter permease [Paenibacillus]ALS23014.1 ABC transporter permease [Paenibacillus naphthalenovorans]NTZ17389.1 sugar ABC transporter permease [Paenibacillus sp. JMULE4]
MEIEKGTVGSGIKKKEQKIRRSSRIIGKTTPYLWLLPSISLIVFITVFPIYELFSASVSQISLSGVKKGYIGFRNFSNVLSDAVFLTVLKNTLIWTVSVVGISTVLSLGIAQLLNRDFPGRRWVRAALIIPWAVSLIITSVIWKWILDYNYGALNLILLKLNLINENIFWLASPSTSFPAMIGVGIFVTIPFTSFVLLSGLQSISAELYESASVDGANAWSQFYHVTLPLLRQPLTISTVLNTIYVFNSFPIIWSMTKGDPVHQTDTIITYLYKLAFAAHKMGEAAAVSVISFLLLLLFSIIYTTIALRRE